jgi:hypothetical protein
MGLSSADEWDLTVPADDAELVAELRRRGVRPGRRVHVRVVGDDEAAPVGEDLYGSLAGFPDPSWKDFKHASLAARRDFGVT